MRDMISTWRKSIIIAQDINDILSFGERSNFILNLINIIENNNNFYYNINSMKMSSNITTMFEYLHPIIPKYSFNDTVKQRSHVIKKDYNLLLTTVTLKTTLRHI